MRPTNGNCYFAELNSLDKTPFYGSCPSEFFMYLSFIFCCGELSSICLWVCYSVLLVLLDIVCTTWVLFFGCILMIGLVSILYSFFVIHCFINESVLRNEMGSMHMYSMHFPITLSCMWLISEGGWFPSLYWHISCQWSCFVKVLNTVHWHNVAPHQVIHPNSCNSHWMRND